MTIPHSSGNSHPRNPILGLLLALSFGYASCGGGSGDSTPTTRGGAGADLLRIHSGRSVDVYGLLADENGRSTGAISLYRRDALVGFDIQDEREGSSTKKDHEITYDFIGVDPETLQQKLLITRILGTQAFQDAFDKLDAKALLVASGYYGQNTGTQPFTVVPRNAALRLTFNKDLQLPKDFFIDFGSDGRPIAIKNPTAVELLEIVGDPTDGDPTGDFRRITCRIAHYKNTITLDPVLLGREGAFFNVPNNASGLPESPNSTTANIRIAMAFEGPLRLPGLTQRVDAKFISTNLAGTRSLIRDFRSGNAKDISPNLQNGFVRETIPPRVVGEMKMRLEGARKISEQEQILVLFKAGVKHAIDRGDVLKMFTLDGNGNQKTLVTEVIVDPSDNPEDQYVQVQIRDVSPFLPFDPHLKKAFTDLKTQAEREAWLVENGKLVVLAAEFFGGDPKKNDGDDPSNFITFTPSPIPDPGQKTVASNRNISPFASLVVRFSKPVNLDTVRPFDSLMLATTGDTSTLLTAKTGTPHIFLASTFDEDGSGTALRIAPPLGFYIDDTMRDPKNKNNFPYYLHVIGGFRGIRDFAGNPVDFQYSQGTSAEERHLVFPFYLDTNKEKSGEPRFPNNRVVNIVRRFLDIDEDEGEKGIQDWFGSTTVVNGKVIGRPVSRSTSFVDDRNQLPSPPNFPFSYCKGGQFVRLTGASPLGSPILNPMNPWGCRKQVVWNEIDLSLSRTNPFDFNLDVEQMWWAPFQQGAAGSRNIIYDVFDRLSLFISHSERRPSNCVSIGSSFPSYPNSSLRQQFYHNIARNLKRTATTFLAKPGDIEERPGPHIAYEDQELVILHKFLAFDPTGSTRFLPLPTFKKDNGYLVWRDERLDITGGGDTIDQILSPFGPQNDRFWNGAVNTMPTDGKIGTIALPLLADFWAYVDSKDLPKKNPFFATGANGVQLSITVGSSPRPYYRVFSGGSLIQGQTARFVRPGDPQWKSASGGFNPLTGAPTPWGDNTQMWMRVDFRRSISVMTYGFLNLEDPHNDTLNKFEDPRLGSNGSYKMGLNEEPAFETVFEPPLSTLPTGTRIVSEFRGADKAKGSYKAFDPRLTGDAHIRDASSSSSWWTFKYTEKLTKYTEDPNDLFDAAYLAPFKLTPDQIKIMNFRFIFENNPDAANPTPPTLDSFGLVYRIEKTR